MVKRAASPMPDGPRAGGNMGEALIITDRTPAMWRGLFVCYQRRSRAMWMADTCRQGW